MNDTVKRLMNLADEYADAQEGFGKSELTLAQRDNTRRILEAELLRLFTPLTDEQIATVYFGATGQSLRPQDNALAHKFAKAIENQHGIGETK